MRVGNSAYPLTIEKDAKVMEKFVYQALLTPEDDGGFSSEIPDLPGCYSQGDDFKNAVEMIADAGKTYVAALMKDGESIPPATVHAVPEGDLETWVYFETDSSYIVDGDVVSAAQAARELGISAGRVTHMLDSGLLDGYRSGRRTYVTRKSIDLRLSSPRGAGRPKKTVSVG